MTIKMFVPQSCTRFAAPALIFVLAVMALVWAGAQFVLAQDAKEAAPPVADASVEPPPLQTQIVYFGKTYEEAPPLSLLDPILEDNGIKGAEIALAETNTTGRLVNQHYEIVKAIIPEADDAIAKAKELLAAGHRLFVTDLEAEELLAFADLPEAKDAIILNVRSSFDTLRQEQCRINVFHIIPSSSMRADALAQYLLWKRWRRWFVVTGTKPADLDFLAAIKRAAARFGGKIVEEREYKFDAGSRRTDTGHQQIQTQMPLVTQQAADHDVVMVADVTEAFGEYLLFRTSEPRPVVGTHGLVAVAWHRSFEQYAAMQMQSRFERLAKRVMTERDYASWLGVRIFGESVTRVGVNTAAELRSYLLSDKFGVAGFKGEAMNFRAWDQQLRQPMLIAGPRALVSISPQDGFLHEKFLTDTLGVDEPETKCRMKKK